MARFITVHLECDWPDCGTVDIEGEGTVGLRRLSLDGKQEKEFVICKTHGDVLDEILLPLLQKGIKVPAPSKKSTRSSSGSGAGSGTGSNDVPAAAAGGSAETSAGTVAGKGHKSEFFDCRVPECGRTLHNRTGLAQHVIRTHGFASLIDYENTHPASTGGAQSINDSTEEKTKT